jgi:hypothetical protein
MSFSTVCPLLHQYNKQQLVQLASYYIFKESHIGYMQNKPNLKFNSPRVDYKQYGRTGSENGSFVANACNL